MLTIQSNTCSAEGRIREMDGGELSDFIGRLQTKVNEEIITPEELRHMGVAKQNFKQITGSDWMPSQK